MALYASFFEFKKASDSDNRTKQINQILPSIRERFEGTEHRIINVETVHPTYFWGFQKHSGGLRVWYESDREVTESTGSINKVFEQINS